MKYLIINADDFGLNAGVNRGIIRAWEAGAITNATLMIKKEGAREAVDYAKNHPSFPAGLHIDIDEPLFGKRKGKERFEKSYLKTRLGDPRVLKGIEEEICRQMDLFEKSGLKLFHVDSHHHLHALPEVFDILLKSLEGNNVATLRVARDFDLVKYPSLEWNDIFYDKVENALNKRRIHKTDHFFSLQKIASLEEIPDGVTEIMTHPGKGEGWRECELEFLMSDKWKTLCEQDNVKLISFRDLAGMTRGERNGYVLQK